MAPMGRQRGADSHVSCVFRCLINSPQTGNVALICAAARHVILSVRVCVFVE